MTAELGDGASDEVAGSEREGSPDVFRAGRETFSVARVGLGDGRVVGDAIKPGVMGVRPLIKRGGGRRAVRVFEENSRGEGAGEG